jgi:hydrogenase expression/formation protein HypC
MIEARAIIGPGLLEGFRMCLAIPMRLTERDEFEGVVELDGIQRTISLMLLPEAEVGQHVLVHAGYAIGAVNEDEAAATLELLREYADAMVDL